MFPGSVLHQEDDGLTWSLHLPPRIPTQGRSCLSDLSLGCCNEESGEKKIEDWKEAHKRKTWRDLAVKLRKIVACEGSVQSRKRMGALKSIPGDFGSIFWCSRDIHIKVLRCF